MESLSSRLARGDESAFAELYDAIADRLYRFLLARMGSPECAADVLQATFLRLVEKRRNFRRVENPPAYVFRVAINEATREQSKRQRQGKGRVPLIDSTAEPSGLTSDESEVIAVALSKLDSQDRQLVELKTYGNLTFKEIAEALQLPPGTVATRYRRALESLRPWLTQQWQ
jgi:RNA polymerase sigma-70 factor (ECF subfamily)